MAPTRTNVVPPEGEGAVSEEALQLGVDDHLVGVLARPSYGGGDGPAKAAVLFLNAGVIHRVGPHRLHVTLARRLAGRGVTSLRIDLSGIGDSRPVPGALSFRESAVIDARSAMDRLQADTGGRRFVLFGLCSGADNALATAAVDDRVVGLVLLDPPAYVTTRARVRRLAARVRRLRGVRAVVAWGATTIARRVGARSRGADAAATEGGRETPPLAVYHAQLSALVDRRVAILAVFSGALGERYYDDGQLFELFPEMRGRIDVAYFPAANHTFTELAAQARLVDTVTAWLDRRA